MHWWAGNFFWTKPSLAGSAASASTTAFGGSPARTCRREHGCASSRSKTVRRFGWKRHEPQILAANSGEYEMRKFVTGLALAICALGAAPSAILGTGAAFAQQAGSPPGSPDAGLKQAPLTEAQIKQYLAAQKEVAAVFASLPPP